MVKKAKGLTVKIFMTMVMMILVVADVVACSKPAAETTTVAGYKLTHSAADAEHILSWDMIISKCPDIGNYSKQEAFIRRGENQSSGAGGISSIEMDSPAAWGSMRTVQTALTGEKMRGLGVFIAYCELDEYLDEILATQASGFPVQHDGDFMMGTIEQEAPVRSMQLLLAGEHFVVMILESASEEESLFLNKEELMELLPGIESRISSLEIIPLPPDIPERNMQGGTYEWQEFMTFRSSELSPPVRVPEGQHYNDLIYGERPLMQVFNFMMDKDWRFVMTVEGETVTRFEVYITVTSPAEGGLSYSTDHVFTLHSSPLTIIREEPLQERYTPPVDIEIKVFFDHPMEWVMTIEK